MVFDVVMPKMGESITEGTILEWRKNSGDSIEKDEILLEIGTDKVDSEIPSSHKGTITEILAEPNDVIEVGKVIARIETEGDSGGLKVEETKDETTDIEELLPEKIEVKGDGQHPLYTWLCSKEKNGKSNSTVKWNFEKYLVDEKGEFVNYFLCEH